MTYLYGDSSPSTIEINYIDFLGRILDFSVEMLIAEGRVSAAHERRRDLERAVMVEIDLLEELGVDVHRLLEPLEPGSSQKPTSRCARAIERAVIEAISEETSSVRGDLASDVDRIQAEVRWEREAYIKSLESLVAAYDLPGADNEIHLALDFGEQYTAQLRGATDYGAATSVDLDVPGDSPFVRQVRIGHFAPGLEIHTPERVGWIRKQVKMISHNVSKHYLAELTASPDEICFKLRTTADFASPGYNILVDRRCAVVELAYRKSANDEFMPFDVAFEDEVPLIELAEALAAAADELTGSRRALLEVTLDGQPLVEHDRPAVLIERMVEAMAPVVADIAEHSLSPDELVLRCPLGECRREEIFSCKSDLAKKLAALPEASQGIFESLGLGPIPEPEIEPEVEPESELESEGSIQLESAIVVTGELPALQTTEVDVAEIAESNPSIEIDFDSDMMIEPLRAEPPPLP